MKDDQPQEPPAGASDPRGTQRPHPPPHAQRRQLDLRFWAGSSLRWLVVRQPPQGLYDGFIPLTPCCWPRRGRCNGGAAWRPGDGGPLQAPFSLVLDSRGHLRRPSSTDSMSPPRQLWLKSRALDPLQTRSNIVQPTGIGEMRRVEVLLWSLLISVYLTAESFLPASAQPRRDQPGPHPRYPTGSVMQSSGVHCRFSHSRNLPRTRSRTTAR
jgi:hypothetical protein